MSNTHTPDGIRIDAPVTDAFSRILTPEALAFVGDLARRFDDRRRELMARRETVQAGIDAGRLPDFLSETKAVRDGDWTVAPVPADLADRRVEITGPVDRKMVINALNSGQKHTWPISRTATAPPGRTPSTARSTFAMPSTGPSSS
jgi:malate synthase